MVAVWAAETLLKEQRAEFELERQAMKAEREEHELVRACPQPRPPGAATPGLARRRRAEGPARTRTATRAARRRLTPAL